jgi:hypothetical protein
VSRLLRDAGLSELLRAVVSVFGGNAWDPQDGRETPWLDLAWQLAGAEGVRALGPTARDRRAGPRRGSEASKEGRPRLHDCRDFGRDGAPYPREAVHCLEGLVEADLEGWGILGWGGHARTILAAAMGSGDAQAREAGTALFTAWERGGE